MGQSGLTWRIYLNHCLSAWGDRMWDFSVGLYLVILYPDSLLLTAILGFTICLSVILFGSHLGKWIDKTQRLKVANYGLLIQNSLVIIGSILLSLNVVYQIELQLIWSGYLQHLLYAAIILCAVIANLASVASDIAIEKDWIVVLSDGDDAKLARMNSTMRTIDLTTHILAPLILGQIITYVSQLSGLIFIAVWNAISALIEYRLLMVIYKKMPQLSLKETFPNEAKSFSLTEKIGESLEAWQLYFQHSVRFAGIAFAMLYMTVLGFDSITLGYIYSQGGSESFLGIVTGVGATLGILGSATYPYLRYNMGKHSTGNIGFGLNVLFLMFCVGSVFGPGSPFQPESIFHPFEGTNNALQENKSLSDLWSQNINVFYFVFGIVLARYGLWMADLSVTQILQENVEERERGIINGVQNSLNQLMDLLKFLLVIIFPSPQAFAYLIFLTWIFMFIAWIFFIVYVIGNGSLTRQGSRESLEEQGYLLKDSQGKLYS